MSFEAALEPTSGAWPNVMATPQGNSTFVAGETIPINYLYQRVAGNGMDVVIQLDNDTNPYNQVPAGHACNRQIATIPISAASAATPGRGTYQWTTSSIDRIPGCFVVLRARTYTSGPTSTIARERFDYLPSPLYVSSPAPGSFNTSFNVPANYPTNQNVLQTLAVAGAQNLAVTVTGSLDSDDYLIITDQTGATIGQLTGGVTQSFNVVGSQIGVRFISDYCCSGTSSPGATVSVVAGATLPIDTIADAFSFVAVNGVQPGYTTLSDEVTVSGINAPTVASISNGLFRINRGNWTTSGWVNGGDQVQVLVVNSAASGTSVTAMLTIGGISAPFVVTTVDRLPDRFQFAPQHYVPVATERISDCVVVSGLGAATTVSVRGGEYQLGCLGAYSANVATIANGQSIRVRHTSAATDGTLMQTLLCVGEYCAKFNSSTNGGSFVCNLDANGDGAVTAASDAMLLVRYLAGFRSGALLGTIPLGNGRPNLLALESYLSNMAQFDVFSRNTGAPTSTLDGLVLSRLMLGFSDDALMSGITAPIGAQHISANAIRTNVNQRCGTAF